MQTFSTEEKQEQAHLYAKIGGNMGYLYSIMGGNPFINIKNDKGNNTALSEMQLQCPYCTRSKSDSIG